MKSFIFLLAIVAAASATQLTSIGETILANAFSPYKQIGHVYTEEELGFFLFDFFNGIVQGVNITFRSDLRLFKGCIACPPKIWKVWVKFYEYIKDITWQNFKAMELVDHVIRLLGDTIGNAVPCIILGMMIDKFVELILNPTWEQLKYTFLKTFASNAQLVFNDLVDFVGSIFKGDFYGAGEDIGQIIYILIVH